MSTQLDTHDHTRPSGRHQLNIGHLVMGLAFLGVVGVWALVQGDVVDGDDVRWLLPVPWVVAGAAGLAASAVTGSRRHAVRQAGWVGDPVAEEPLSPAEPEPTRPYESPAQPPAENPETRENPETPEEQR